AVAGHFANVLAEIADRYPAIDRDLALIGQLGAVDHPEQCGLAGAVWADQAYFFPLLERCGGFDEENLMAVLLADIVEANHWNTRKVAGLRRLLGHVAHLRKCCRAAHGCWAIASAFSGCSNRIWACSLGVSAGLMRPNAVLGRQADQGKIQQESNG